MWYVIGVGHKAQGIRFKTCDKDFSPNRKNSSCQEMIGQYLRGLSMGPLEEGFKVASCELRVIGLTTD